MWSMKAGVHLAVSATVAALAGAVAGCGFMAEPVSPVFVQRATSGLVLANDCPTGPRFTSVRVSGRDANGKARTWSVQATDGGTATVALLVSPAPGWRSARNDNGVFLPVGEVALYYDSEIGSGEFDFAPSEVEGSRVAWFGGVSDFTEFKEDAGGRAETCPR